MQRSVQTGRHGLTEDKYDDLLNFTIESDKFSEREKAALTYASATIWDAAIADDALWALCIATSRSLSSWSSDSSSP